MRGGVRRRDAVLYATYAAAGSEPELPPVERPAALVIGSGPVRIGQGIEFDYCAVQAAAELRERGWQAVMINSNPRRFRPTLTPRPASTSSRWIRRASVLWSSRVARSRPLLGAFVQFGGQTPLNLAEPLAAAGIPLLGAELETIDQAEDRIRFANLVEAVGIPQPEGGMARSIEEALALADRIGYPVIVRPSFVIAASPSTSATHHRTWSVSWRAQPSSTRIGRFGSTATSRELRWTLTRSPMARRC